MPADLVVDASLFGAAFFNERDSTLARAFLERGPALIAPDLLFAEIASIAAKKVWRGEASQAVGARALQVLPEFVITFEPSATLAARAFALAAQYRVSAYDGIYVALAESRATQLVTLDDRLIIRLAESGLTGLAIRPQT